MALAFTTAVVVTATPTMAQTALYACDGETTPAHRVGLMLCDASPTDALESRAEPDNLQVREGSLVVELEEDGISLVAGLQPGDLIYRVGGADVGDTDATVAALNAIGSTADTVVNFLRSGRPYRIKLRRE